MGDEKSKKTSLSRESDHHPIAENAATSYGLEDHEATAQDPRVNELKHLQSQPRRLSGPHSSKIMHTPRTVSNDPSTAKVRPTIEPTVQRKSSKGTPILPSPAESSYKITEKLEKPQTVVVYNPPPCLGKPKFEGLQMPQDGGITKTTNTDITFDPSKEYATKTTNTSLILYQESTVVVPEVPKPEPDLKKPSKEQLDEWFAFGVALVKKAGAHALSASKDRLSYTAKANDNDVNTRTNTEVEQMMTKAITEKYPNHKIIDEEAVSKTQTRQVVLTADPTWVIDPIDGTMNYVHRFPYYCISLALFVNKETTFGIIFNPPLQELYTARKGEGARLNDEPMVTSGQENLKQAMILQEYSSGMNDARSSTSMENTKRLVNKTHALRSIGSSAMGLAMVASGVADAFYFFGLHVWDMAAGIILVTEAGGTVIDPAGGEVDIMSRRVLAASTKLLALALSEELVQNYPKPRDDSEKEGDPQTKNFSAQTEFSDSSDELDSESSHATAYHNAQ